MYDLKDKVGLVTGAAKGIGAAIAKELLEEGVQHVRILDIDEETGVSFQNELNEKYGENKAKFVKCDVTDQEAFYKAIDDTKEENSFLDILVNNAGIPCENNLSMIRKQIEINFIALVNGTLRAIELMRTDKGGRGGIVINVSSIAGLLTHLPAFIYSSTKRAVMQFCTCIGNEPCANTGVRVMAICYGVTDTAILGTINCFEKHFDEEIQKILGLLPMQSAQSAGRGTMEVIQKGESASTWLVQNSQPARDLTSILLKADQDMDRVLQGLE